MLVLINKPRHLSQGRRGPKCPDWSMVVAIASSYHLDMDCNHDSHTRISVDYLCLSLTIN